jgi:hypothetical protein
VVKVGYHVGLWIGVRRKRLYTRRLLAGASLRRPPQRRITARVVSFSGIKDLGEQSASIASFLRWCGVPRSWTVISDGSHSEREVARLEYLHRCVEVVPWTIFRHPGSPEHVLRYAEAEPLGKKLVALAGLGGSGRLLYADSDVLFFPGANDLHRLVRDDGAPLFLLDCAPALDDRLLRDGELTLPPVNSGLLVLRGRLDWAPALGRVALAHGATRLHTEQTAVHIAMHAAGGEALDPAKYVMQIADQFMYGDAFASPDIAARHYVRQIRFKLWLHAERLAHRPLSKRGRVKAL